MAPRRPILDDLLKKARSLPKVPGVYLMKDADGRVIYVGKASCLPDRVSSYFVPSAPRSAGLGPKKLPMLDEVDDFDTLQCDGEWEALLTENRLIKDIRPKYNVRLTDDKTFPYLVVTTKEDFPGVFITRQPSEYKGAKVLGPFTSVYALREAVQLLQRVFKFRTCTLDIRQDDDKRKFFRPCLLYAIGQCTAPCGDKISEPAYRDDIQRFIRFLESKRSSMLREMRQDMQAASENLEFEKAAALRDQIRAIEKLDQRGKRSQQWQPETESLTLDPTKGIASLQRALETDAELRCLECIDIAHLQGGQTVGSKVCFIDGRPLKNQYRRYKIRSAQNDDYTSIREVVSRCYREAGAGNQLYPDLIIIDGGKGQLSAALESFSQFQHQPPMVVSLAKKEELIYQSTRPEPVRLSRTNPGLKLCQAIRDEAHRFAQHYHHILRRKKVLEED